MLGRLQMDIDTCINKYRELSEAAFQSKRAKGNLLGKVRDIWKTHGKYSSTRLVSEIRTIVESVEGDASAKLMSSNTPCKTFVCAMTKSPKTRFLFRTYTTDKGVDAQASLGCTIWEAARATSAAPTFFDPISIGGQSFVDGATGLNNPVEVVLEEAKSIWTNAISRIQCVVSIGTGLPNFKKFGDDAKEVVETLVAISTETEDTERRFLQSHESLNGRYFRYNVDKGLGEVGLDEHNEVDWIIRATESYLEEPRMEKTIEAFATAHDPSILPPLDEASKRKRLTWLRYTDTSEYYVHAREQVTKSTGDWFLKGEFDVWKVKPKSFLWLYGKAGCGKTILSSTIIREIEKAGLGPLAYFYFSFQRKGREPQDYVGLVQSLLIQIVKGLIYQDSLRTDHYHLPRAFRKLYDDNNNELSSRLEIEKLKPAFLGVLAESKETYIIIDALDECPEPEDREKVIDFLIWLSRCAQSSIHILITSRRERDIENAISKMPREDLCMIPIQDRKANHDIRRHLQTRMEEDSVFKTWDHELQARVVEDLIEKADGVFRWVKCQLDTLRKLRERTTEEDIENALRDLPKDLDETYHRMLLNVNEGRFANEARAVLRWLAASERPLKLSEAAEAAVFCYSPESGSVSVNLKKRFKRLTGIRSVLSGLVTISRLDDRPHFEDEETDYWHDASVNFAHFSVKEYLECNRVDPAEFRLLESDTQSFILKSCLAYIHYYDNQASKEAGSEQFPLLLYACKYWPYHAIELYYHEGQTIGRLAELLAIHKGPTLILSTRVALGLEDREFQETLSPILCYWLKNSESGNSFTELKFDFESSSAIHLASSVGEKGLVKLLLDSGVNVKKEDHCRITALHWAASCGHEAIVELLLQNGADIEKEGDNGGTPLASAIENGYEAVTELLLVKGAKVDYKYHPGVGGLHPEPSSRWLTPASSAIAVCE
ncbi:MAG: hypothetical protein M1813_001311 [Trichoglossum hirsutum]|nr:MAG: hypothetical protein M1813_001311 [Trichoglossum hirsutum]